MTTCCGDPIWYANITPDIDDLSVIEDAKTIVDACYPQQKSTFFGGHYYCFLTREYLLNLLLFYHDAHKCFPVGQICIVDKWLWSCDAYRATKNTHNAAIAPAAVVLRDGGARACGSSLQHARANAAPMRGS